MIALAEKKKKLTSVDKPTVVYMQALDKGMEMTDFRFFAILLDDDIQIKRRKKELSTALSSVKKKLKRNIMARMTALGVAITPADFNRLQLNQR